MFIVTIQDKDGVSLRLNSLRAGSALQLSAFTAGSLRTSLCSLSVALFSVSRYTVCSQVYRLASKSCPGNFEKAYLELKGHFQEATELWTLGVMAFGPVSIPEFSV